MQLLEVKNDIAKILYSPTEKQLLLSDFILLEDVNQSLICQITEIESSSNDNTNIATVKLSLSISKNSNLTTYNGYIPSKDANVIYISPQEMAQLIKSSKTNLYWGKLSAHNDVPIYIGLNFLRDKAYIRCDNIDNSELLNANLIYNLQFNKKRTVVFDTQGCFRNIAPATVLTLGRNFKLPLNVQAFEFIATNDLTECSVESKAFIQGILIELEEYAQSLDSKFIPFSLFKKVIEEQAKFNSIPELLILRNKILRYEQYGLFAETEEDFKIFSDNLAKSTITTIDSSSVEEKYQKLLLRIITSKINKKCYLIFTATDYNTDKQTITQIYDNSNIRPVVTSSYDYKCSGLLKSHCKNSVLFAPVDKRTDDDGYGLFQNKLRQREFIVYGENTFYMPLILKLEAIDKNIFEKLLDEEIKDDVDKFLLHSSQKAKDDVIQNIADKDPSTINFDDKVKKTPTIKPVNYVVQTTPEITSEKKQFSEILQEETKIEELSSKTEDIEDVNVYAIDTKEEQTPEEQTVEDQPKEEEKPQTENKEEEDFELTFKDFEEEDSSPSPMDIQQAYEEETGIGLPEIAEKVKAGDENTPEIIIKDSESDTEKISEAPEIQQFYEKEIEAKALKAEEKLKSDEILTENKAELLQNEQESLFENQITFDEPNLSNINIDFSSSENLDFTSQTSDFENIGFEDKNTTTETDEEKTKEDITSDDLDFLDEYEGVEEAAIEENSQPSILETYIDKEIKEEEKKIETSSIEEITEKKSENEPSIDKIPVKEDTQEKIKEEQAVKISSDEDDTIEEIKEEQPVTIPSDEDDTIEEIKEEQPVTIPSDEDDAIEEIREEQPATISSNDSQKDAESQTENIVIEEEDNTEILFVSDNDMTNSDNVDSNNEMAVQNEFDDLTEEDEAVLDMQDENVLVINENSNDININEIETEPEEEVDATSLIEEFIEPPEEKQISEKPKETQTQTVAEEATYADSIIEPEVKKQEEKDTKPVSNSETYSFVEDMMPPEEVEDEGEITPEQEKEPLIQINNQPETSADSTDSQFLEVVNQINQTKQDEENKPQAEEEENVHEEQDDEKLFSAFNINESTQVRRDKLTTDPAQKRRVEQPKQEQTSKDDETRQDIPVYSAQTQSSKDESELNYAVGDWVFHPKYGRGQVESFAQYSNKILFCTILFDNFGRRTLDAKLTGLEKIK